MARPGERATTARDLGDRLAAVPRLRRWAAAASLGWVVVVVAYAVGFARVAGVQPGSMTFLDGLFLLVALVLPLILVWLAVWLAEALERQREIISALAEVTAPMIGSLRATRQALEAQGPASPEAIGEAVRAAVSGSRGADLAGPLGQVLAGQARIEAALQRLSAVPPKPKPEPEATPAKVVAPAAESASPGPGEAEGAPPAWSELVRALDFPRDADDKEGFRALRSVLRHQGLAQMLQAAEDVLNLLSQEGVFVDELPMQPVDTAAWRRFMAGTRGAEVAAVGGIEDSGALETVRRLMKADTIFRDTALFFQRRFDAVLAEFAQGASDAELIDLAGTRSGRVFMLLVKLSGSLD